MNAPGQAEKVDVLVLGAGAAGFMAAIEAGKRGKNVVLLDHAETIGEKIRISGGGRCNFTNVNTGPKNFVSENPKFCVSALARYKPRDFLALVEKHKIEWYEKTLGQLFCRESANQIIEMLLDELAASGGLLVAGASVRDINKGEDFEVFTTRGNWRAPRLIVATGGPSIPKIGATGFAYELAERFGIPVVRPRPALTPFLFDEDLKARSGKLAGVSTEVTARTPGSPVFREAGLFTHRGLSGPALLQASSYWRQGQPLTVDFAPGRDLGAELIAAKTAHPKREIATALGAGLPQRLAAFLAEEAQAWGTLADASHAELRRVGAAIHALDLRPVGLEGWRIAEVAAGGVDVRALDSQSMEVRAVPGLHFIGECLDVTGWLGGYNFQWAWASGAAVGRSI
ncbi:BaiN/RdsA family NAD(P)/FAD-dependent oxidoreductase [Neomegalonema perideroedes]|uniref:NAD(P)/FAD-dependent oxidoreductase n=1 Tax=Neomegalonema perideroedes TaxID=217219 RepID=UPI00037CC67C|nr:aminoacetone oxidase family FAD-binding enzyme [Neomegalonema perideroedes]